MQVTRAAYHAPALAHAGSFHEVTHGWGFGIGFGWGWGWGW